MKRSSIAALREENRNTEAAYQHAKATALRCAAERDAANAEIAALRSACKGSNDTVLRIAGERDEALARVEALHADLRVRTAERDAMRGKADASDTRALTAEADAKEWCVIAQTSMVDAGRAMGYAEMLARLTVDNRQGAYEAAHLILTTKWKPCSP